MFRLAYHFRFTFYGCCKERNNVLKFSYSTLYINKFRGYKLQKKPKGVVTSKGAIEEHSLKLALDILEFMMKKKGLRRI